VANSHELGCFMGTQISGSWVAPGGWVRVVELRFNYFDYVFDLLDLVDAPKWTFFLLLSGLLTSIHIYIYILSSSSKQVQLYKGEGNGQLNYGYGPYKL
jgi:hypothetical protein